MKNPITSSDMFWSPKTPEELHNYIERMSGTEKALAYTIMGITGNLCSNMVDAALKEELVKE